MQLGGKTMSDDGMQVRGYLDQKPWIELAQWYYDNGKSGVLGEAEPNWTSDTFAAGEGAFYLSHIGQFDLGGAQPKFEWDASTEPYFERGKPVAQTSGCAWVISKASTNKEAAATFLKYITIDPEASWELTSGNFFASLPLTQENAARLKVDPAYKQFPKSVKQIGLYETENWQASYPKSPAVVEYWQYFQEVFVDLRVGAREPSAAIMDLTDRVDRALERYR